MAKCKGCGKEIPDGLEYCEDCLTQLNTSDREASMSQEEGSLFAVSESQEPEEDIPEFGAGLPKFEEEEIPEFGAGLPKFDEGGTEELEASVSGQEEIPEFGTGEDIPEFGTGEDIPDFGVGEDVQEFGTGEETPEFGAAARQSDAESSEDEGLNALLDSIGSGMQEDSKKLFEDGPSAEELLASSNFDDDIAEILSGFGGEFGEEQPKQTTKSTKPAVNDEVLQEKPSGEENGKQENGKKIKKPKEKKEKKEKKPSVWKQKLHALWHKLFDNVKVDPSKVKPKPTPEELEAKKKATLEAKEKEKAKKEAEAAEKKDAAKKQKEEKQRRARAIKEEKKARKLEEAKLLLEEMETTRINRAGASIVFIFFAMIAVVVIVGTNLFSYSLSIRNAEYEFNRDEYTAAYNEIFGLDVKDEDIMLYDRIMTVMYVQKQLNSYYNYYELKDYPRALDSLLKGLQRYEKYIELAIELGVETDLDSVRNSILAQAEESFQLSEREAMEIIQSRSRLEYSEKVYKAAENRKD